MPRGLLSVRYDIPAMYDIPANETVYETLKLQKKEAFQRRFKAFFRWKTVKHCTVFLFFVCTWSIQLQVDATAGNIRLAPDKQTTAWLK